MEIFNIRLDLNESEFYTMMRYIDMEALEKTMKHLKDNGIIDPVEETLLTKLTNPKKINHSPKKANATENATKKRTENARLKIENAINILRMEDKKINPNSVSVLSGCSINTVKKYI